VGLAQRKLRGQKGFTIVELLIVIVVISILATLTVFTYNTAQMKARDSKRAEETRNFAQIIESFYAINGYYPPYNPAVGVGVADSTWRTANLPDLKNSILTPPGAAGVSLVNNATPTTSQYGYYNNGSCTGSGAATQCSQVRIYWRSEIDGLIKTYTGTTG